MFDYSQLKTVDVERLIKTHSTSSDLTVTDKIKMYIWIEFEREKVPIVLVM